jgi:pimeloyl-ACP methyl ester carboxylesterase
MVADRFHLRNVGYYVSGMAKEKEMTKQVSAAVRFAFIIVALLTGMIVSHLAAQEAQSERETCITDGLAIGVVGKYGRSAIYSDLLEYQFAKGKLETPVEGTGIGKSRSRWQKISADKDGWFKSYLLRGGYLYVHVNSEKDTVMILESTGHGMLFVNGEPRGGDVYNYKWVQHPIRLKKGRNDIFLRGSRGKVRVKLVKPRSPIMLTDRDVTLPELLVGQDETVWGAVRVINATNETLKDLKIYCDLKGPTVVSDVPVIGPMTSRKAGFQIKSAKPETEGELKTIITLVRSDGLNEEKLDTAELKLKACTRDSLRKRTFVSEIDGSVQYYGVRLGKIPEGQKPALFVSLHGAGVAADSLAGAYGAKDWGHVVTPTNRRPFGFDWEDWGRLDVLEVMQIAKQRYGTDPKRTYLSGHSMGGHGTWHVGVIFPDRFAAIAPSAGWYSFYSYGGKRRYENPTPVQDLIQRASSASNTLELSRNYLHYGIYILHGQKDDNVPVSQARFMKKHLAEFHGDFTYYERPGAGHWWGSECVDWPPLFDFLKRHTLPDKKEVKTVEFLTASPGISARSNWVCIEAQKHCMKLSSIKITQNTGRRTFRGTTSNVARMTIDVDQLEPGKTVNVELDGQKIENINIPAGITSVRLVWYRGKWYTGAESVAELKGPHRYGTFKDAFRHRVMFVYSTKGTVDENTWSYNKARYDAESFWYRANGSIDVVADVDFDPAAEPDRNVILYGNADTNGAWKALLGASPMQVKRDGITIGARRLEGDDIGCYFVRPRPASDIAMVGVVAGTGTAGMKAVNGNRYFISGSGYPDVLVLSADMLFKHFDGVRAAGYFGIDWSVENGEFAWSK